MNASTQKSFQRRLKIIEGQVRGVQRMIEEDRYCIDIITQTSAIKRSLSSLEDSLMKNHLETHVAEHLDAETNRTLIDEIVKVYTLK